jgi:hypothetical protein
VGDPRHQQGDSTWLLYDGAALRHCCNLLYETEVAADADLELSVRMLGRAHLEAWFVALYIHFAGYEALLKVAQDARHARNPVRPTEHSRLLGHRCRRRRKPRIRIRRNSLPV